MLTDQKNPLAKPTPGTEVFLEKYSKLHKKLTKLPISVEYKKYLQRDNKKVPNFLENVRTDNYDLIESDTDRYKELS